MNQIYFTSLLECTIFIYLFMRLDYVFMNKVYFLYIHTVCFISYTVFMMKSWTHFPRYWPFVRGIHRWPVNSPHKGQWRRALMFSLICVWINGRVNNREAGDLRRHGGHYDVTVIYSVSKVLALRVVLILIIYMVIRSTLGFLDVKKHPSYIHQAINLHTHNLGMDK